MKVNIKNTTKIDEVLNSSQKYCRVRTIMLSDVVKMVNRVEKQLEKRLYKKDWKGIRFLIDYNGQSFPNAYKGVPESTQVEIERGASAWFATAIKRDTCNSMEIYPLNLATKATELAAFVQDHKNWN